MGCLWTRIQPCENSTSTAPLLDQRDEELDRITRRMNRLNTRYCNLTVKYEVIHRNQMYILRIIDPQRDHRMDE